MNVLFFPANKLQAAIAPIFNGFTAILSQNTDRLIDAKHELGEIAAFKHNIQCTSFLNPYGVEGGENANYKKLIEDVNSSGRISFGLYWRSDRWVNPMTFETEQIPDYYASAWTEAGVSVFKNAVLGASKATRYPNHGQQMFDISGGDFGFDAVGFVLGKSKGIETLDHTKRQISYFKDLANLDITTFSYTNGASGGWTLLSQIAIGVRNSVHSVNRNGAINYHETTRSAMLQQASTTRTWDAANANQFASQEESLSYSALEVQRAVLAGGWYSDFMHWHSLYVSNDTVFFDPFMSALDAAAGQNTWRAGNNEANEYLVLSKAVKKVGSFVYQNRGYICVDFKDYFKFSSIYGLPSKIDFQAINTPISLVVDLKNTTLSGKIIGGDDLVLSRNLGDDKWVLSFKPASYVTDCLIFCFYEDINANVYTDSRPSIAIDADIVSASMPCKFVIWSKDALDLDTQYRAVYRTDVFSTDCTFQFQANKAYKIGAINESRHSSLIDYVL